MADSAVGLLQEDIRNLSDTLVRASEQLATMVSTCTSCASHYRQLGLDVAQVFEVGKVVAVGMGKHVATWQQSLESWESDAARLATDLTVENALTRATSIRDGLNDLHEAAQAWLETLEDLHDRLGARADRLPFRNSSFHGLVLKAERSSTKAVRVRRSIARVGTR